jgi:HSP20 family protein
MFVVPFVRPSRTSQVAAHRAALAPHFSLALDRFFDEPLDRVFGGNGARTPAMDVSETDNAYSVVLEVPGVTREQLKVSVQGRRVTVESTDVAKVADAAATEQTPATESPTAPRVLYRERSVAHFSRTVSLPSEVDQASSQAKFENGVLTLTLSKKVPTGATQISVS